MNIIKALAMHLREHRERHKERETERFGTAVVAPPLVLAFLATDWKPPPRACKETTKLALTKLEVCLEFFLRKAVAMRRSDLGIRRFEN
jgi:hypothetical protein